jgi:hypothetical protein
MWDKDKSGENGRFLTYNFPALKVGTAVTNDDDPTGCTIFLFPERVMATCDVRGGDPGVSEYQYSHYDAICFAGGSLRGLEVVGGVRWLSTGRDAISFPARLSMTAVIALMSAIPTSSWGWPPITRPKLTAFRSVRWERDEMCGWVVGVVAVPACRNRRGKGVRLVSLGRPKLPFLQS